MALSVLVKSESKHEIETQRAEIAQNESIRLKIKVIFFKDDYWKDYYSLLIKKYLKMAWLLKNWKMSSIEPRSM